MFKKQGPCAQYARLLGFLPSAVGVCMALCPLASCVLEGGSAAPVFRLDCFSRISSRWHSLFHLTSAPESTMQACSTREGRLYFSILWTRFYSTLIVVLFSDAEADLWTRAVMATPPVPAALLGWLQ